MWPQLSSPLEHFFLSLSPLLLSWCALDLAAHILVASVREVASRLTRPGMVSASGVPRTRLSPGALHVRCAAGFVTREACSPQTTFSPCRRRGRQAPNPVCALRRLEKHRGERPPLQHGSACEPGSITSCPHQHCPALLYQGTPSSHDSPGHVTSAVAGSPPLSTRRHRL
jgi:hypothetical protein